MNKETKSPATIIASNGKIKREFSKYAWSLLPIDKDGSRNGWKEVGTNTPPEAKKPVQETPGDQDGEQTPGPAIQKSRVEELSGKTAAQMEDILTELGVKFEKKSRKSVLAELILQAESKGGESNESN
jgi:hypothetical protein